MKSLIAVCIVLAVGVYAVKLPAYLKKCPKGPTGTDCINENGKAAVAALTNDGAPKFHLQSLTPIRLERIILQATPALKITITNGEFRGFEHLTMSGGLITDDNITLAAHIPRMQLTGDYNIDGKILILPIHGEGRINMTIVNYDVLYKAKLHVEERKGKLYHQVHNDETSTITTQNITRMYWNLENLFNGDARLSEEMDKFLNENWRDVFEEIRGAVEEMAAHSIVNYYVNGYLHYIPIEDLYATSDADAGKNEANAPTKR